MPPSRFHPMKLLPWLLLATLPACSQWTGHEPIRSTLNPGNPLQHLPAQVSDQPLPAQWWQLYQDPQLNHLVQQALTHNQDLAAAQAHVQTLLGGLHQADAQRWPSTQVQLGASYGKTADDQTLAQATDSHAPAQWEFNPGLELAYQVDVWGQVQHAIEQAQASAEAAVAAEDQLRVTVAAQTTRAYVSACALAARAAVQRQSLAVLGDSVRLLKRQRQGGVVTDFEVSRMRALLGQTQAQVPMLEARRQAAVFELATLTGSAAPEAVTCTQVPQLQDELPVGDGWQWLSRRPDIRQANRELQAASLQVEVTQADLYPKVTFGASLTSSSHPVNELGSSQAVMFGIGPLISWQFPNRAANHARVEQAKAMEQGALARFDGQVLLALQQVRQALALYDGERQRYGALAGALSDSQRAFDLAQRNYQAGALDFLDVLDSERELISLKAQLADADGQLLQRQINLFAALGGGWQRPQALSAHADGSSR
ncbi:efflux transporter outer membrane subunit [Pseudomonas putida]